ncbi:unnamed protein product, partial [Polarella glacialis]
DYNNGLRRIGNDWATALRTFALANVAQLGEHSWSMLRSARSGASVGAAWRALLGLARIAWLGAPARFGSAWRALLGAPARCAWRALLGAVCLRGLARIAWRALLGAAWRSLRSARMVSFTALEVIRGTDDKEKKKAMKARARTTTTPTTTTTTKTKHKTPAACLSLIHCHL